MFLCGYVFCVLVDFDWVKEFFPSVKFKMSCSRSPVGHMIPWFTSGFE